MKGLLTRERLMLVVSYIALVLIWQLLSFEVAVIVVLGELLAEQLKEKYRTPD